MVHMFLTSITFNFFMHDSFTFGNRVKNTTTFFSFAAYGIIIDNAEISQTKGCLLKKTS